MFTAAQEETYKSALVRFYQDKKVIGAGLYCSPRYVLTCAHVVTQSLGLGKTSVRVAADAVAGKPIELDFPFVAERRLQAEVVPELWRFNDEDLAMLKLASNPEGAVPLSLPESSHYRDHGYYVFGFPEGCPDGTEANGVLLGTEVKGRVQLEDTNAQGYAIEPGFSGAPVWDHELGGIAGITVARDQARPEAKVGFMIPYAMLRSGLEAIALFELLLPEAENLAPHWSNAYRLVRPEISTESRPATLKAAILQVQEMPGQDGGYRAIDRFIGYLALPEWNLKVQPRLIQWLLNQGVDAGTLIELLQPQVAEQQAKQGVGLAHLLVWVKPKSNSDRYSVEAYLIPNADQYDSAATEVRSFQELESGSGEAQLEEFLQICIMESRCQFSDEELQVEIFLPRQYLRWQVDQWRDRKKSPSRPNFRSVSSRFSVVLRCADRLDSNQCDAQERRVWKQKWQISNSMNGPAAAQRLTCGNHPDAASLYDRLEPELIMGWHRLQPPLPSVADNEACHFSVLLGTGAFVAIWLRKTSLNAEPELAQLLGSCLSELPAKVFELRKAAAQRPDKTSPHIGEQISLIWDDPKLVPPIAPIVPRFRMPA
jgi:hypothetical protein